MLSKSTCACAHTHKHTTPPSGQDRKIKYCGKHTRRTTQACAIRHKGETSLGCMLTEETRWLSKSRDYSISQETKFPWLQGQSQKEKGKKAMSGAAKFVFPSWNVSAHWWLNHFHGLLKQMPPEATDSTLVIKCTWAFWGRIFFCMEQEFCIAVRRFESIPAGRSFLTTNGCWMTCFHSQAALKRM